MNAKEKDPQKLESLQRRARALHGKLPTRYMAILKHLHPDEAWEDPKLQHKIRNVAQARSADPVWISRLEALKISK